MVDHVCLSLSLYMVATRAAGQPATRKASACCSPMNNLFWSAGASRPADRSTVVLAAAVHGTATDTTMCRGRTHIPGACQEWPGEQKKHGPHHTALSIPIPKYVWPLSGGEVLFRSCWYRVCLCVRAISILKPNGQVSCPRLLSLCITCLFHDC